MTVNKGNPWEDDRLSAYVDGMLTPAEREQFERELATWPAMQAAVDELRGIRQRLQQLPPESLPADFAERILQIAERRLLLGRDRTAEARSAAPTPRATTSWRRFKWALIAVAAALALTTFLLVRPGKEEPIAKVPRIDAATRGTASLGRAAGELAKERLVLPDALGIEGTAPPAAGLGGNKPGKDAVTDGMDHADLRGNEAPRAAIEMMDKKEERTPASSPASSSPAYDQTVVVVPRDRRELAVVQQLLQTAMAPAPIAARAMADEEEMAPREGGFGQRQNRLHGGGRRERESKSASDEHPNARKQTVYDAFLVTAPSPDVLHGLLDQLAAEQIASQTIPLPPADQISWRALVQQLPRVPPQDRGDANQAPAGEDSFTRSKSTSRAATLAVIPLGRLPAPPLPAASDSDRLQVLQQGANHLGQEQLRTLVREGNDWKSPMAGEEPSSFLLILEAEDFDQ